MKKICVFTGSRAEYGLLKPLLDAIKGDRHFTLQLLVSGMHLSPEFGLTYKEIEEDGYFIDERVEMIVSSDTSEGTAVSIGIGVAGMASALRRLSPEAVVILGDRFEAFACAVAAMTLRVPIMHIHGGEVTEGAIDEAYRHSITKMSTLHFASIDEYRKRIIQLGEQPDSVFSVGALGIDNIMKLRLLTKKSLEKALGVKFAKRNLLVTFHPETIHANVARAQFSTVLSALNELKQTFLIFTKSNADAGGRIINSLIDRYVAQHKEKAMAFTSLGQMKYLSLVNVVDAVVGNSSSGIIEVPSFRIGTVNIGDRQRGRIRAVSVIDCKTTREGIKDAFSKLYSREFAMILRNTSNPYGDGKTAGRIKKILKAYNAKGSGGKKFFDLVFTV